MAEVQSVIDLSPQGYFVSNVTPTGGTMLNGIPVRQAPLHDGDEIGVGPYVMQFCITRSMRTYIAQRPIGMWPAQPQEIARQADRIRDLHWSPGQAAPVPASG